MLLSTLPTPPRLVVRKYAAHEYSCAAFVAAIERGNLMAVQFHPEKAARLD